MPRQRLAEQEEIQGPEDDAVGFTGAGAGDDEQGPIEVSDDLALDLVEARVLFENGRGDAQRSPAFRKLNVSWGEMIRWSTTRTLTVAAARAMARVRIWSASVGETVPFG